MSKLEAQFADLILRYDLRGPTVINDLWALFGNCNHTQEQQYEQDNL